MKKRKEGTGKVSGRLVIISAFYADFCLFPKSVIITTLTHSSSIFPPDVIITAELTSLNTL